MSYQPQTVVQEFDTGAIRDIKEIPSNWEKFSLPALRQVVLRCQDDDGHIAKWSDTQPLELVSLAIESIYDFISHSDPLPHRDKHLSLAFRHLMYAYELKTLPIQQIKEIIAMRAEIGNESCYTGYHLLGYNTLKRLAETRFEGGVKYGSWNWINGFPIMSVLSHALEHMWAICGAMYDEDHWGHAFCNLMFAIHFTIFRPDLIKGQLGADYTLTDEIRKELEDHRLLREKAKREADEQRLRESTVRRDPERNDFTASASESEAVDNGCGRELESSSNRRDKKGGPRSRTKRS